MGGIIKQRIKKILKVIYGMELIFLIYICYTYNKGTFGDLASIAMFIYIFLPSILLISVIYLLVK